MKVSLLGVLAMDYRFAGVDIKKGDSLLSRIKAMMGASGERLGHFGGAIPLPVEKYRHPLLVSSIDGVGTKVKVAAAIGRFDTIGQDLVHHSINDIACCGAEPLAFLDYIAMHSLDVDIAADIVGGVVKACERWNVALAGGESAEMPGVYRSGELDLVGSIFGVVDQDDYIDGRDIVTGDVLIGFASNGLHTNGYSLARKVVESAGADYNDTPAGLEESIGNALLTIHRCYLKEISELRRKYSVKGLAHITGGGLPGNVARIIPNGMQADIQWDCWSEPSVFDLLRRWGNIPEDDMRTTFNLGIGLVAVLNHEMAEAALHSLPGELIQPVRIGAILAAE